MANSQRSTINLGELDEYEQAQQRERQRAGKNIWNRPLAQEKTCWRSGGQAIPPTPVKTGIGSAQLSAVSPQPKAADRKSKIQNPKSKRPRLPSSQLLAAIEAHLREGTPAEIGWRRKVAEAHCVTRDRVEQLETEIRRKLYSPPAAVPIVATAGTGPADPQSKIQNPKSAGEAETRRSSGMETPGSAEPASRPSRIIGLPAPVMISGLADAAMAAQGAKDAEGERGGLGEGETPATPNQALVAAPTHNDQQTTFAAQRLPIELDLRVRITVEVVVDRRPA